MTTDATIREMNRTALEACRLKGLAVGSGPEWWIEFTRSILQQTQAVRLPANPGNLEAVKALDQREIYEQAMPALGWKPEQFARDEIGYENPGVRFGWDVWKIARSATLIEAALWYKSAGYLLDEDDIPQAILELNKPTP